MNRFRRSSSTRRLEDSLIGTLARRAGDIFRAVRRFGDVGASGAFGKSLNDRPERGNFPSLVARASI